MNRFRRPSEKVRFQSSSLLSHPGNGSSEAVGVNSAGFRGEIGVAEVNETSGRKLFTDGGNGKTMGNRGSRTLTWK